LGYFCKSPYLIRFAKMNEGGMRLGLATSLIVLMLGGAAQAQGKPDTSPHRVHRVTVEKDVTLEVLDWGGTGRPLVFIPGNGNDAHVFDALALKFTDKHRVYAITRRGVGASSSPAPTPENYDSDRRGDDVLAVLTALRIERPVLAGHSLGGSELSSIGTRRPGRVAGLIYLDASNQFAFYDSDSPLHGLLDANKLRQLLERFSGTKPASEIPMLARDIRASMKQIEKQLRHYEAYASMFPDEKPPPMPPQVLRQWNALLAGSRAYTGVKAPFVAIVAVPKPCTAKCSDGQRWLERYSAGQASSLQKHYPKARIVRLVGADHHVWRSHEVDVVREMNAFMDGLR